MGANNVQAARKAFRGLYVPGMLALLPIVMSYIGISQSGVAHAKKTEAAEPKLWKALSFFANGKVAPVPVVIAVVMAIGGYFMSQDLKIGDLDKGAPELRADSRYNLDNDFMVSNYSTSSDVLVVMVESGKEQCNSYKVRKLKIKR